MSLAARLLPVLQLTRMALVFTAIADSLAALLLHKAVRGGDPLQRVDPVSALAIVLVSVGLYGFGMSLNDIIDRRRDELMAAHRPLPSGRIGVRAAHLVCFALGAVALTAGAFYSLHERGDERSLVLVIAAGALITFYDSAGKYLVAPGLITLGLIRFFHAAIPAPYLPVVWHPLVLLNHVAILSAVAYAWEEKRPVLTRGHWFAVAAGLLAVNALVVGGVWYRRAARDPMLSFDQLMGVTPDLAWVLPAVAGFAVVAWAVRARTATRRAAGQNLMLWGLLWLIVYDATFVAIHAGWRPALAILALLPIAYLSVQLLRWWGRLLTLGQRPDFRRA